MGPTIRLGAASGHAGPSGDRGGAQPRTNRPGGSHRLKLLPRILPDEEEEDQRLDQRVVLDQPEAQSHENGLYWAWTLGVASVAAIPRLLYLFAFTNPQNPGDGLYGDVWHHWQIAYLTKEIGLSAPGGPRLWDLKGLDYFWGVLHPLLMVAVFDVTGSIDIVLNDPFHYLPTGYGYAEHQAIVNMLIEYWLVKTNTRVIAMPPLDANYDQL